MIIKYNQIPILSLLLAWEIYSLVDHATIASYSHMSLAMRKPDFAYAKTKAQISFAVTVKLISAFVFATLIVQSLFYLNPKFQASSHLLWLYSLVCVGPGQKPRRPVFSQRGSYKPTGHGSLVSSLWEVSASS